MRNLFSRLAYAAGVLLALALTFSCSSGGDSPPSETFSSSRSSSSGGTVLCLVEGNCLSFAAETCSLIGGQVVKSCPAASSSSAKVSSSSSVPSSSSSVPPSSSSSIPSSSSVPPQTGIIRGTPITYEGETYETVVIGTQTWMARNLNYDVEGSVCYNDDPTNCAIYGRLYDWATAMGIDAKYNKQEWGGSDAKHQGICPSGWHIPSNADWDKLYRYADGSTGTDSPYASPTAGTKLKSRSGWNSYSGVPAGTDDFGFSALPGGLVYSDSDGYFDYVGNNGFWWSSSEDDSNYAYIRDMYYHDEVASCGNDNKRSLFSVRCVQD